MRLYRIILKLLLLIPAVFILIILCEYHIRESEHQELYEIPEYNYVPEVKKLIYLNRFGEAEELCRDIILQDLPGAEEAKVLHKLCKNESKSASRRIGLVLNGFIKGSANSLEEAGGALVSDLIIYGDIRDLLMQGYFKITGQETDPLIVLLSTAGLATSLLQTADWVPAAMKILVKTGAVTAHFRRTMTRMLRTVLKNGKAGKPVIECFDDLAGLIKRNSFPRTARFMKYINTPKELAFYRKLTAKSSSMPYLILTAGKKNGAYVIAKFGNSRVGNKLLEAAARRGPAGVAWLSRYKVVRTAKWSARIAKAIHTGHAGRFFYHTLRTFPASKWIFLPAALMLLIYSSTIILDLFPGKKKKPEEAEQDSGNKETAAP